jgi:hypothetical protein
MREKEMETREYRTKDKSLWIRGEWDNEPDKVQFTDEDTGLPCLIVRGPSGALCGYVGVAEGHPYFQKEYDAVDVDVHGGLTFNGFCAPDADESKHICHVPSPGEPDHVWWLGFDCAHSGDICPSYAKPYGGPLGLSPHEQYRSFAYVKGEVRKLAQQIKAAQPS